MTASPDTPMPDPADERESLVLQAGNVVLNMTAHRVTVDDRPVALSTKEFQLLSLLLAHRDRVLTRNTLMDLVWGPDYTGDPGTLNVHILRLRHKLERNPHAAPHIRTVHGVGYVFDTTTQPAHNEFS